MFISRPSCKDQAHEEVERGLIVYIGLQNFGVVINNISEDVKKVIIQIERMAVIQFMGARCGIDVHLVGNFSLTS